MGSYHGPPLLQGSPPVVGAPSASLNGEHDGDACCSVLLSPSKDNTLYEDPNGTLSNGAGGHFFAGRTNGGSIRRGVIAFDIEGSIPEGSTITSVKLTLHMSRTLAGSQAVGLHRLESDWGEGSSNAGGNEGSGASAQPGDTTWIHTIFDSALWNAQGGDFPATASATVGGIEDYTWGSNAQMVADVQAWLDDPSTNFGWLLKGNEVQVSETCEEGNAVQIDHPRGGHAIERQRRRCDGGGDRQVEGAWERSFEAVVRHVVWIRTQRMGGRA